MFVQVYRGADLKCSVSDLTPKCEYWVRAAFVSPDAPDTEEGQFCSPINMTTPVPEPAPSPTPAADTTDANKETVASSSQVNMNKNYMTQICCI